MGIFPSTILVAIDDYEEAELPTRRAVALADTTGSELHVVYVGQLPNFLMNDTDIMGFNRKLYDDIERESLEILWRVSLQVKAAGGDVAGAHLRVGNVAEEIVELSKDLEADLIVIGTRGHGGLRRVIWGSISDAVVRRARCAVMTVRTEILIVPIDETNHLLTYAEVDQVVGCLAPAILIPNPLLCTGADRAGVPSRRTRGLAR